MREEAKLSQWLDEYREEDVKEFFAKSAEIEAHGYCRWPRLKETAELCRSMGYKKLGLAFCAGLRSEARIVEGILRRYGFEVVSVACKLGSFDKSLVGIADDQRMHPGEHEPMCNPIMQARLLNEQKTEFNIVMGLCVGHDSLMLKYSDALCTVLIAKDRALGNNPCAAIYTAGGYCADKLGPEAQ